MSALEGLEEDGAGELPGGKSGDVKNRVLALIKPLLPPPAPPAPPHIVDIRQPPRPPSSPAAAVIWSQASLPTTLPAPVESWKILPSSLDIAAIAAITADTAASIWAFIGMADAHLLSPPPAFSQHCSTAGLYYSAPLVTASMPALPLPSMLAPLCGITLGYNSFGGWGLDTGAQVVAGIDEADDSHGTQALCLCGASHTA